MTEKEAKERIKNYVLENFDDRWDTNPMFFTEYADFFKFSINSKKYLASGDFYENIVGLGSAYLSKKYGEIVQYGSALAPWYGLRYFLLTEYRLNVVRTHYEIGRADYNYNVVVKNVTDVDKASEYIKNIWVYRGAEYVEGLQQDTEITLPSVNYFGLLNLLYFNVLDPFCECAYEKRITDFDRSKQLRAFESLCPFESLDRLFYKHIEDKVVEVYPTFDSKENYSAIIYKVHNVEKFDQYFATFHFKHYGFDDQTGFTGYVGYKDEEIAEILKQEEKSFEYVEGEEILFFLFANTIESFCEIEIKKMPNNSN
jgi:hypothetical protein